MPCRVCACSSVVGLSTSLPLFPSPSPSPSLLPRISLSMLRTSAVFVYRCFPFPYDGSSVGKINRVVSTLRLSSRREFACACVGVCVFVCVSCGCGCCGTCFVSCFSVFVTLRGASLVLPCALSFSLTSFRFCQRLSATAVLCCYSGGPSMRSICPPSVRVCTFCPLYICVNHGSPFVLLVSIDRLVSWSASVSVSLLASRLRPALPRGSAIRCPR